MWPRRQFTGRFNEYQGHDKTDLLHVTRHCLAIRHIHYDEQRKAYVTMSERTWPWDQVSRLEFAPIGETMGLEWQVCRLYVWPPDGLRQEVCISFVFRRRRWKTIARAVRSRSRGRVILDLSPLYVRNAAQRAGRARRRSARPGRSRPRRARNRKRAYSQLK